MTRNVPPPTPRAFQGSCHCGAIQFEIWVEDFNVIDCNCSICQKKGFLHLIVPSEHFRLLKDTEVLQTYTFNTGIAKHHFCGICGIAPFYRPRSHPHSYDVNLRCIDGEPLDCSKSLTYSPSMDRSGSKIFIKSLNPLVLPSRTLNPLATRVSRGFLPSVSKF
jgi:hypothetical protein